MSILSQIAITQAQALASSTLGRFDFFVDSLDDKLKAYDDTNTLVIVGGSNIASDIDYTLTVPTDWDGTPANVQQALDELASRVKGIEDKTDLITVSSAVDLDDVKSKADSALQPGDNISELNNDAGYGAGNMLQSTYDPNSVQADAFDYANFLGTFQVKGSVTTVNMSSDFDNLNLNTYNIVNLTSGSQNRRITGIVAPPSGVNRVILFFNASSAFRIKFVHQSGSSSASNRIVLRGLAGTRNLLQYQTCFAIYNHNINRWYITRIA